MTTDLERRLRAGLREYVESVPVAPPPLPSAALNRRRASLDHPRPGRVRRIGLPLLAAAAVVVAVTLVPVGLTLRLSDPQPTGGDRPSLPSRFAPFSFLTGDVDRAPISRAAAVYLQRNNALENWYTDEQLVVLDADGDRYRRIPARNVVLTSSEDFRNRLWHLSPDGRRLAFCRSVRPDEPVWVVLDLATGSLQPFPRDLGFVTHMAAWSPDGRRIAFGSQDSVTGSQIRGRLTIWDLDTGRVHGLDALPPVTEASFSPDGRRIAVRVGAEILILDDTGSVLGRHPIGPRDILAGPAAWSPDGTLLAIERLRSDPEVGLDSPLALRFVTVAGVTPADIAIGAVVPADITLGEHDQPQGWRGNGSFVVWDRTRLVQISVGTGARTTLAETGDEVSHLQLASGLLAELVVREPSRDVDRGPWPSQFTALLALTVALVVLLSVAAILRLTNRPDRIDVFDPDLLP